jgi:CheY-like chemotaxis protein
MSFHTLDDASRDASRSLPVLVVDDDVAARLATLAVLADGGYDGLGEAGGDAALRHINASLVRLVVSELHIPCAEGPCIVAVLKGERTRLPHLRVLVYTRHDTDADLEWAFATGCDALVRKSAAAELFLREVGRLDGRASAPHREVGAR